MNKKFEIIINHSDKHDGMVHLSNFELDPTGEITISLDDFKEALIEAGLEEIGLVLVDLRD